MMRRVWVLPRWAGAGGLLLVSLFWAIQGGRRSHAEPPSAPAVMPSAFVDWSKVVADEDGYFQPLSDGSRLELTLDPRLQHVVERALEQNPTDHAAAVVLGTDGRLLALAGSEHKRAWEL